ncbi:MAG: precorrin-2 dehydrogenase/sirohydrochlorin ferrochelatase family protein [Solirubrobacterales bacterium]
MAASRERPLARLRGAFARLRDGRASGAPPARVKGLLARWRKRGRHWDTRPYYPAILDIARRTTIVVGAGEVGEGKIEGLLRGGARVRVVSHTATDNVRRWAADGRIELELRAYESTDLEGAFLVIAATEDNATNVRVFEDAEARQMLCNVVDVTHLCNFILPSIVRRGDLAIAVSTGGASPAMARRIRLSLEQCYGDEYALAMKLLGSLREELKRVYPAPADRKVLFERIVYSDFMDMVRAGDAERIEAWVQRCIDEGPGYASPEEHRASLEAARPECKLRFQPLEIENLVDTVNGR